MTHFLVLVLLLLSLSVVHSGPLSYAICQTGCNALAVACYGAAGVTFGTVTAGAGIPAAIVACNAGLGVCMSACVAAGLSPIPSRLPRVFAKNLTVQRRFLQSVQESLCVCRP
jgi:hypothetical protein